LLYFLQVPSAEITEDIIVDCTLMSKSDLYFGVIVTAVGEKEQDSVYEVLFDEEFLGGLTIRSVVSETALLFAVVFTAYAEFNFVIYTWLFTRWSFSDISV